MRSLADVVTGQTLYPADLGDATPTAEHLATLETSVKFSCSMSLVDRVTECLQSPNQSCILWALSNVLKCGAARNLAVISKVTELFQHPYPNVEYAAITCCIKLARTDGQSVCPQFLTPVLRRLRESPALEYVNCLERILRFVPIDTIQRTVLPLALEFVQMDEPHQFAGGQILAVLSFVNLRFSHDDFLLLLNSNIIVANYLTTVIARTRSTMAPSWLEAALPKSLLLQGNSFAQMREGILHAMLSVIDRFDARQGYMCCMSAFSWAATNEAVALILVNHADFISQYRNGEFQVKVRDLGIRLSQSPSESFRARLWMIYAQNPMTFLASDVHFKRIFRALSEDPSIDVRVSFVKSFHLLVTRCSSPLLTELLFSCLLPYFMSDDDAICDALVETSVLYSGMKTAKINAILPHFFAILESIIRWRTIASGIAVFLSLPIDVFKQAWRQMAGLVKSKVSLSPHALAERAVNFYARVAEVASNEELIPFLLEYAHSSQHQLRALFVQLMAATAAYISITAFIERLWPAATKLAEDPVVAVRAAFLRGSGCFLGLFLKNQRSDLEKGLTTLFMIMGKETDPYLEAVWRDCLEFFKGSPAVGQEKPSLHVKKGSSQLFTPASMIPDTKHRSIRGSLAKPVMLVPKPARRPKLSLDVGRLPLPVPPLPRPRL